MELSKTQLKLAKNQKYSTKLLYYSLEVMRQIMLLYDKKESEKIDSPYTTDTAQKMDRYFKIIESLKSL